MQTSTSSLDLRGSQVLALYQRLRARCDAVLRCPSDLAFALGASAIWALLYNLRFWHETALAMWQPSPDALLFLVSLFTVVLSVQAILVLLAPTRTLMRAVTSALFLVAAASSYFTNVYGTVMNRDMMRNVLQTDPSEVAGLLSFDAILQFAVLGILPALLVWRVALPQTSWRAQLRQRAVFIVGALTLCVASMFASSASYAVFFREHKPLRFLLSPTAAIVSLTRELSAQARNDADQPLLNPAGRSQRTTAAHAKKPLVLFLVVGETARAANFQLGGYARDTNPQLQAAGVTYFGNVSSCGTATAESVPCMFSHLPKASFEVDEAGRYTNLLDSLAAAGIDVEWRDNNAGCKGVCARVAHFSYEDSGNPQLCRGSYCYDEILLEGLPERLAAIQRDTIIVFHQMGSHGPAYFERYPPDFERFKPACRSNQLQTCSSEEIVNAYDNSIRYTDHVLARQIEMLREASQHVDGALVYVSDHGESLGEQGIYLHGMPYRFAPRTQTHVPMLTWISPSYAARLGIAGDCLRRQAQRPSSHDNLYHTVLGAMQVSNEVYDPALDLTAACSANTVSQQEKAAIDSGAS